MKTGSAQRAFTLIEMLVGVALVAVVLTLAAPTFYDFIVVQRLKSINSQLVTDLQNARAEAATRGTFLRILFQSDDDETCYTLYVLRFGAAASTRCECTRGAGSACSDTTWSEEVRTVRVPNATGVRVVPTARDPAVAFDSLTGGLWSIPSDQAPVPVESFVIDTRIDDPRTLRTTLGRSGRPTVCGTRAGLAAQTC